MKNSNKKNIGIIFPPRSGNGGIFQYAMSVAEALINYCDDFTYTILYFDESPKEWLALRNPEKVSFIALQQRKNTIIDKAGIVVGMLTGKPIFRIGMRNKGLLHNAHLDLLILTSPLLAGFEYDIPYILPILDMMYENYHLYFPEYSSLKTRLISRVVLTYLANRATLCVGDSEYDKKDIMKFLLQPEAKVRAISLIPPGYIYEYKNMNQEEAQQLLKKFNVPEKFIFYPAQFWPHKNHLRLIESIAILKQKYHEKIYLVLAGNPKVNMGNYHKIKELTKNLGIEDQIFIVGYVTDQEMVAWYKKATALIFPTFAGPTNIPPLEAMLLGTPVLCSNLFDMPKQVGNAGIVFDPRKPDEMVEKIHQVWQNDNLRNTMIQAGYQQVKHLTFENYAKEWILTVKKALTILT